MCLAPRDFSPLSVAETPSTLKEFAAERIEAQKEQYVKRRRPQKVSAEWDHLPSDYKYWIYPAACLVAWYLGKSEFMAHLMAGTLLRYAINLAFTALSKLDCVAEPRRIHKENPPANQLERELDWDGPIILSPVAFLLVDALTPWFSTIAPFSAKGVGVMFAAHYGIVEVRLRPPAPQFLPLVLTAHLTTCSRAWATSPTSRSPSSCRRGAAASPSPSSTSTSPSSTCSTASATATSSSSRAGRRRGRSSGCCTPARTTRSTTRSSSSTSSSSPMWDYMCGTVRA